MIFFLLKFKVSLADKFNAAYVLYIGSTMVPRSAALVPNQSKAKSV